MNMRNCRNWFFIIYLLTVIPSMYAQEEPNLSFKLPINIDRATYSSPGFVYGIKSVSGKIDEFNYVLLRTYTIVAKAESAPCKINPPIKIMVGFIGFSPSAVSSANELYTAPIDTSVFPCVHNVLADLMVKKRMQFDFKDIKKLKILIFNLNTEKELYKNLQDKFMVSSGSDKLFFLIWDQYKEPGLPVVMQSCKPLNINVNEPLKFKGEFKPAIAQAVQSAPPRETAKPIPPSAVVPVESVIAKETPKEKAPVPQPSPPTGNPEPRTQVPEPGVQNPAAAPSGLIHEIQILADEFLLKNKIDKEKAQLTYSLNKRIDSLKIKVVSDKGEKNYVMLIPQYPPMPVKFTQPEDFRRKDEDDVELPDIIKMYIGKMKIKFYNQEMYFDSLTSTVLIPKAFSPVDKIRVEGLEPAVSKLVIDDKEQPASLNIQVKIPKTPLKLTVLDKLTSMPITNLDLKIYYRKKKDPYDGAYNSGEELNNKLFKLPGITYTILLNHPDYNPLKSFTFSNKDFEKENTHAMEIKRAYNMIYVDLSAGNRMVLKTMLQEKIGRYLELKIPFFLVVSNGQKPMVIKDQAAFNDFISKIGITITLQPNAKIDRDAILNNLPLDSLAKVNNIQFQYFLSTDTYASSADGLINDLLKDLKLYVKTKPDIYIYINYDIPDERKNRDYIYHTISN